MFPLGFRKFITMQASPSFMTRAIRLAIPPAQRGDRSAARELASNRRLYQPLLCLLRKDARLVLPTILVSTSLSFLFFCSHAFRQSDDLLGWDIFLHLAIQVGIMPGIASVALIVGDRVPGVRETLMTAPVSARLQWLIKLGVSFLSAVIIVLVSLAPLGFYGFDPDAGEHPENRLLIFFYPACHVALLSLYGATTSSNAVRSLATAFFLAIGAGIFCALISGWLSTAALHPGASDPRYDALFAAHYLIPRVFPALLFLFFAPIVYRNMRQLKTPREIGFQLSGVAAFGVILLATAELIIPDF